MKLLIQKNLTFVWEILISISFGDLEEGFQEKLDRELVVDVYRVPNKQVQLLFGEQYCWKMFLNKGAFFHAFKIWIVLFNLVGDWLSDVLYPSEPENLSRISELKGSNKHCCWIDISSDLKILWFHFLFVDKFNAWFLTQFYDRGMKDCLASKIVGAGTLTRRWEDFGLKIWENESLLFVF